MTFLNLESIKNIKDIKKIEEASLFFKSKKEKISRLKNILNTAKVSRFDKNKFEKFKEFILSFLTKKIFQKKYTKGYSDSEIKTLLKNKQINNFNENYFVMILRNLNYPLLDLEYNKHGMIGYFVDLSTKNKVKKAIENINLYDLSDLDQNLQKEIRSRFIEIAYDEYAEASIFIDLKTNKLFYTIEFDFLSLTPLGDFGLSYQPKKIAKIIDNKINAKR